MLNNFIIIENIWIMIFRLDKTFRAIKYIS